MVMSGCEKQFTGPEILSHYLQGPYSRAQVAYGCPRHLPIMYRLSNYSYKQPQGGDICVAVSAAVASMRTGACLITMQQRFRARGSDHFYPSKSRASCLYRTSSSEAWSNSIPGDQSSEESRMPPIDGQAPGVVGGGLWIP